MLRHSASRAAGLHGLGAASRTVSGWRTCGAARSAIDRLPEHRFVGSRCEIVGYVLGLVCLVHSVYSLRRIFWIGFSSPEMSTPPDEPNNTHSTSDGRLEVLGIVSSFHIAQLQVGLNKPIRLGQAKTVKVSCEKTRESRGKSANNFKHKRSHRSSPNNGIPSKWTANRGCRHRPTSQSHTAARPPF